MYMGSAKKACGAVLCALTLQVAASAQTLPWLQFEDPVSGSICDVVNAANLELVVLDPTGELAGVTGTDVIFLDTFVDNTGNVFFQGIPAGFIDFAADGDGFATLWLFTPFGDLADIDEFTGQLAATNLFPTDFIDVPCDACPFWDEPDECQDSDVDGVVDAFDICPLTPLDELPDVDGCSCSQLDDDLDGVDNCFDLCPDTPLIVLVDVDGCPCSDFDSDLDGVDDCFDLCSNTPLFEVPDIDGCSCSQLDDDIDGVNNCIDFCPNTPLTVTVVDAVGCAIVPVVVDPCGSFGAVILGVMLFGLVGMRAGARRG
ncbi:MAG: hypothetical protein PVI86_14415 [Phycisphaerae bacterium]|jgi:hypothetical protein